MKLNLNAAHLLGQASRDSFGLLFRIAERLAGPAEGIQILDVGSYRGSFARQALNTFADRDFTVHCFDAFAGNIETARAELRDPRVRFVHAAVTAEDRESVTFSIPKVSFVGKNTWGGRVALDPTATRFAADEKVSVRGLSLDSYLMSLGISGPLIVKLDIQGGEYEALQGMKQSLPEIPLLFVECQLKDGHDLHYITFLEEAGFAVVMDSFQFGLRPDLSRDECDAICKVMGLEIYEFVSQGVIFGVARDTAKIPEALGPNSAFAPFFTYFQTDLLAVNTRQPAAMTAFFETLLSR